MSRLAVVLVAMVLVAAACGTSSDSDTGAASASTSASGDEPSGSAAGSDGSTSGSAEATAAFPCTADPLPSAPRNVQASGLRWMFGEPFPDSVGEPLLSSSLIIPVLRADGIPAIDSPRCQRVADVQFLADDEAVILLEVNGDARAYPLQILTWHELVNDTVGGEAITLSYCPLCNSAIAYDRVVGERVLDFGTSGALHQSSMVMYDRQTETLWTHFNGQAVAGELVGEQLEFLPTQVVSWSTFRDEHPDGLVLSLETGFQRAYGANPYPGYESNDDPIDQFITNDVDPRLPAKDRVVGVELEGEAIAVQHASLFEAGVLTFELAGRNLVAWNEQGTVSALDTDRVSSGTDVGSSAVFVPVVDGQELTFSRTTDGFVDEQTGSTWSILGRATAGSLQGAELERVPALDTFWFAWGTFHPGTGII